jgi:pimeloyl-ACP methyl ester carboxylesterase
MADMANRVAGSALVELDGAGHLTPIEAGHEFTTAVIAFLGADA